MVEIILDCLYLPRIYYQNTAQCYIYNNLTLLPNGKFL